MNFQKFYTKFGMLLTVSIIFTATAFAQNPRATPTPTMIVNQDNREMPIAAGNNLLCAGYVGTAPVNTSSKIIGAQNEKDGFNFAQNDYIYVNFGTNRGAKVGDLYAVVRPRGKVDTRWTKKRNLGFYVQEVGAVELVDVKNEFSVARIKTSCENFLLGDLLQPMPNRVSPLFVQRPAMDLFANSSGKTSGRIFMARDGQELLGRETVVYIDLGAEDNVRVGDYLTIYRPLGTGNILDTQQNESVSARDAGFQSEEYRGGKFSNQASRKSGDTAQGRVVTTNDAKEGRPALRRVLGEMVILNVKEKTATAIITRSASEIHTGDRVELQ
ncbi:hypothetical protein BH20ACI1_BH20ACI1_06150 [soil metagenome]